MRATNPAYVAETSSAPWRRHGRFVKDCIDTMAGMHAVKSGMGAFVGAFDRSEDADLAAEAPALLAALRAILPYALSRCEDIEDQCDDDRVEADLASDHGVALAPDLAAKHARNREALEKARAAYAQAEAAIARAEGRE